MTHDHDPPMSAEELAASLAAFDLCWPFAADGWEFGRFAFRPDHGSYEQARAAVMAGRRAVSIAGSVTVESGGQRRRGIGGMRLLLRPDSLPPRDRWAIGGGQWAIH